jgi:predicted N-acetyltransferase YhbS
MVTSSISTSPASTPPQSGLPAVRFATPDDDAFVEDLHALAFGPGRFARTAFRVRERFPIDPSLSLISEIDGVPSGSVWMTPISVSGIDGYLLGPLATHPNYRKRGAGKLLAREVTRLALDRGEGVFVLLVGDQDYYCPLGWVPTVPGTVKFPGPVDPTRVLVYSKDPTLAARLAGPIAAWGAKRAS